MGAMDEWANDAPQKHNPIGHDLALVGAVLLLPIVEWWDDRQPLERAAAIGKAVIVLAAAVCVVFLSGCRSDEPKPAEVPGVDQGHVPFNSNQALVGRLNTLETNR